MKHLVFCLFFMLFSIFGYSQTFKDLIVTETNDSITCNITLLNDKNFFYDHKTKNGIVNDIMPIKNVRYYSYGSNKSSKKIESTPDTTKAREYEGTKYFYCQLVGTAKLFSTQVTINIDYGQTKNIWRDNRLKDETGKIQTFNSMIDALNYMGNQGWELVQAYAITVSGQNVYHYLLKRSQ